MTDKMTAEQALEWLQTIAAISVAVVTDRPLSFSYQEAVKFQAAVKALAAPRVPEGWSGWACQYPGKMPKLYGAREVAELNWYPEEGQKLIFLSEVTAAPAPADSEPFSPNPECETRSDCRASGFCMDAWKCGSAAPADETCPECGRTGSHREGCPDTYLIGYKPADFELARLRERVKVLEAQLEPDMFWEADDPECFRGSDIADAIRDIMDQAVLDDGEWIDITLQRAVSLSNLRVRARYVSDYDIEYEAVGKEAASLRGGSDE